jgi:predicted metal-dependent hydrolase
MASPAPDYDRRYLGGILFFNDRDFFQAHEVWEDLWMDSTGPERRFYQALIQAAVALYHFGNGNLRGAIKLFHSSRDYMQPYRPKYLGLDADEFWRKMENCFAEVLAQSDPDRDLRPAEEKVPVIALNPAPEDWPDPADFEEPEGAA